jgi:hypothetical protein
MAQIIIMARYYQKRPSEIMGLDDEYLAFCFDEVALYILSEITEKDGKLNWNKLNRGNSEKSSNQSFLEFVKKQKS